MCRKASLLFLLSNGELKAKESIAGFYGMNVPMVAQNQVVVIKYAILLNI